MIVYNVKRRFFTKKDEAEICRKAEGLKPAATIRIEVDSREDLAALLNALCDPGADPVAEANLPATDPAALLDSAFVVSSTDIPDCVPLFLLGPEQRRQRELRKARASADGVGGGVEPREG